MFSERGDYILAGGERLYYPGNASVTLTGNAADFKISVSGGLHGDSYDLRFAGPPSESLHPGLYLNAQRAPFRTAGHPGIDIGGSGRGCNTIGGRFDVKDIVTDPTGAIVRLWLTYEQHCENGKPALFGEVRFAAAGSAGWLAAPRMIWWPDIDAGTGSKTVPVTLVNTGTHALSVASASVTGVNAADFRKRLDECTGTTLLATESCNVFLRFVPAKRGPRFAKLVFRDGAGRKIRVTLDGIGIGGRTRLVMHSDPGDFVGDGRDWSYSPTNASIVVTGNHSLITTDIDANNGDWWNLVFQAPADDILAPGATFNATRYPFNNGGAGMDVSGEGRGCNVLSGTFTVKKIAFAPDATPRYLGIDFVQHCENATPAFHGTLEYRLPTGDMVAPRPVTHLRAVRKGSCAAVSWTNPSNLDYGITVVRYLKAATAPGLPSSGFSGFAARGRSTRICGLVRGQPLRIAAWALDRTGNVSRRADALA